MHRVFGVVGRSGSGKTTLIEAMIPWFNDQGLEVAIIKHSHHNLAFEPPQKDSSRFRSAGAREVIVASPYHYGIFHNLKNENEPLLKDLVQRIQGADLILVEGYRQAAIPRIEVHRPSRGIDPVYDSTEQVIAMVSDEALPHIHLPCLPLGQPATVGAFILAYLRKKNN